MAAADYRLCDLCRAKAFYDCTLNYDFQAYPDTGLFNLGAWCVVCRECAKRFEIKITEKEPKP